MDARITVAQLTGALPNSESPKVIKLTKPQTDQAIIIHLDGATKLDLTAIGNDNVTFVHVGDRLVILFDNHSTVTVEPFYDSKGLPLADITVELNADRTVSGAEFASLFPITTDQSILPAAGNGGSPASGANFETVTVNQFANSHTPLALLGSEAPTGNGGPTNGTATLPSLLVLGPTLGVHDVSGSEDKPITLGIADALSNSDLRTSLGNLTITGVPAGAVLSAGIHNADGSWTLTAAQLTGLTLTSDGEVQHFTLTVAGTTIDSSITKTSTATFHVDVTPVADAPVLTVGASQFSAREDTSIALGIKAALSEVDADAVLTNVTISGFPPGVSLSDANHDKLNIVNGSITLTQAELDGLSITSDGEVQQFELNVTVATVDSGATATSTATISVSITPVADTPTLTLGNGLPPLLALNEGVPNKAVVISPLSATASGLEDKPIALAIKAALGEVDADAVLSVTISDIPAGVTLSAGTLNADGSVTLTPAQLAGLTLTGDGEAQHFNLTVTATTVDGGDTATSASLSGTYHIDVTPVADAPLVGFTNPPVTVSADANGNLVGADQVAIDGDGGIVAFHTRGAVLNFNGLNDEIFVKNLETGTLTLASSDANGNPAVHTIGNANFAAANLQVTIDGDGQLVAFQSNATNLVTTTKPLGDNEIFVKNLTTGAVTLASTDASGTPLLGSSIEAAISADGKTVTFESGPDSSSTQVFQKNLVTGALTLVSADAGGNAANAFEPQSELLAVSSDGRFVAFESRATNLDTHATDGKLQIFIKDTQTGVVKLASSDVNGNEAIDAKSLASSFADGVSISADGRFVAFVSNATNLTANATDGKLEIFVKDTQTGAVTLASADANGVEGNAQSFSPSISGDGRFVTFVTSAANLLGRPSSVGPFEIVTKDLQTGAVSIVSQDPSGALGNSSSIVPEVSADGRIVVGVTNASNLGGSASASQAFTTHAVFGVEDKPIAILLPAPQPAEADKDATLTLSLSGIPAGVTLDNASHSIPTIVKGSVTLTPAQLDGLTLTSNGEIRSFDLTATATTNDSGSTASTSSVLHVDVAPVADAPTLTVVNNSGNEDTPIALSIKAALSEVDADAVVTTITISGIPPGVVLNNAASNVPAAVNGSVTLTPAQLAGLSLTSDGETQHFDLTVKATTVDGGVIATSASTSATLHVDVTPVADAPALSLPFIVKTIDVPGALNITEAHGNNNSGQIVGEFFDNSGTHGFVDKAGVFTTINDPNATGFTQALGINDSGQIVGVFTNAGVTNSTGVHGFFDNNGAFTTIDVPGAILTRALGINASGEIAGSFQDNKGVFHGFVDINNSFTTVDVTLPSVSSTQVLGLNNAGDLVGTFNDNTGTHGFVDHGGVFTAIDAPGAVSTQAFGINNLGQVAGTFVDSAGQVHTFIDNGGNIITLNLPSGLTGPAGQVGINDAGLVAGSFIDGTGTHGVQAGSILSGLEDVPIALGISAVVSEADKDAVVTVTISGIPSGVVLDNTNRDVPTVVGGSVKLTPAQLAGLSLTSDGEIQHFDLTVTATTVDGQTPGTPLSPLQTASTTGAIHIDVTPVPFAPTLDAIVTPASINEDTTIALNLTPHFEVDADATNTVTIAGLPSNAILNNGIQIGRAHV